MAKMYEVYSVIERPKQEAFWLNIGVAFAHEKGDGFNVILQALPLNFPHGIGSQKSKPLLTPDFCRPNLRALRARFRFLEMRSMAVTDFEQEEGRSGVRIKIMNWMAKLFRLAIRIDGPPYGARPNRSASTGIGQTSP